MQNLGILLALSSVGILVIFGMIVYNNSPVFGAPIVQVSPSCGPADPGFSIVIDANGFAPNSNVAWKLVDYKGTIPLYGYFQTNATGGLTQVTAVDDVPSGSYKVLLGNDMNNDGKLDPGAPTSYANITMPCPSQK